MDKKSNQKKVTHSIRFPPEVYSLLTKGADLNNMSLNSYIIRLLENQLDYKKELKNPLHEKRRRRNKDNFYSDSNQKVLKT